ncbi:CNP1-like family protein [Rhodoferax sp.]|uniref:CNP1-like family protein n=1 Tax=Rhodoferax sp. TaxID=50421 RepID=UPI0025F56C71|nr:CNP1-like family protein [Rhodoferax sp.]MCM2341137.1 CNP1-like family protein [Rhodoferax sp.]
MPELRFPHHLTSALKNWLLLGLACCALGAQAQGPADDPDWKETEVPAPPKFDAKQRVAIDMPPYVSMKFGIDPATLAITPDGIVRYTMVAVSPSGAVNAFYEGIRCATGEVKSYARANASGVWTLVKDPQWRRLNDKQPSKHALALAQQAACEGNASASSAADILKKLKGN